MSMHKKLLGYNAFLTRKCNYFVLGVNKLSEIIPALHQLRAQVDKPDKPRFPVSDKHKLSQFLVSDQHEFMVSDQVELSDQPDFSDQPELSDQPEMMVSDQVELSDQPDFSDQPEFLVTYQPEFELQDQPEFLDQPEFQNPEFSVEQPEFPNS